MPGKEPGNIRPYTWFGVRFEDIGKEEAVGECPFCSEEPFHVSVETGKYSCKKCQSQGNVRSFLWKLHEMGTTVELPVLSKERGISAYTLKRWGFRKCHLKDNWIVPAYNLKRNIANLYRWAKIKCKDGTYKQTLLGCPGQDAYLFGLQNFVEKRKEIALLEGPWDGAAFDEQARKEKRKLNVLATPGSGTFKDIWLPLFADKVVYICFDNDHPRINPKTGTVTQGGWQGTERTARMLRGTAAEIYVLEWGIDGFDPSLPDGYDVRDFLNEGRKAR